MITKGGWVLIYDDGTNQAVTAGDAVTSGRDELFTVLGGTPPHKPSSSGRVYVQHVDDGWKQEYFPSVFNLRWIELSKEATS